MTARGEPLGSPPQTGGKSEVTLRHPCSKTWKKAPPNLSSVRSGLRVPRTGCTVLSRPCLLLLGVGGGGSPNCDGETAGVRKARDVAQSVGSLGPVI